MSTSITFFSKLPISKEDLKSFVLQFENGYWLEHGYFRGELVEDGMISGDKEETIYIYHDGNDFSEAYDEIDFAKIVEKLGDFPKSSISIQVGHGKGSGKLTLLFADKLLEKWGGLIDFDSTSRELLEDD